MNVRLHKHYIGSVKGRKIYAEHRTDWDHHLDSAGARRHHDREMKRFLTLQKRAAILGKLPEAGIAPFGGIVNIPSTVGVDASVEFERLVRREIRKHQRKFKLENDEVKIGAFSIIMPVVWRALRRSFKKDKVTGIWVRRTSIQAS